MSTEQQPQQHRPVSIPHLIFGVAFTGIAAVWAIGEATNADLPRTAIGFPAVLICAGIVGLVATIVNARRRNQVVAPTTEAARTVEDTTVLETGSTPDAPDTPDTPEPTVVLDDPGTPFTHEEKR